MPAQERKLFMSKLFIPRFMAGCDLFFISLFALAPSIYAQATSQSIDRAQIGRDQTATAPGPIVTTTGAEDGHVVTSPNDADLGEQQILKRTEAYQPFTASVAVPFYWTSNVALTNQGEQSDFLVSPVAAIAYQPRFTKNLSGVIGVREQLFYYDRLTSFDFGSFDVDVGLTYTVPQIHNLVLHAGYDYNRLTKKNSFESFFSNHIFAVSAEMVFPLNRAQQLSTGIDSNISMDAVPQGPRRHDFGGYVGYSAQVARSVLVGASVRLVVHDYVQTDRVDLSEIVALNATYTLNRLISASAIASFAANQSNHSVFDYQVGNLGGSVAFSIRF
jgi:hypothetical protein